MRFRKIQPHSIERITSIADSSGKPNALKGKTLKANQCVATFQSLFQHWHNAASPARECRQWIYARTPPSRPLNDFY